MTNSANVRTAIIGVASPEAIANRVQTPDLYGGEGFRGISNEWWHFDLLAGKQFPIRDIAFDAIG
jgi:D-alanyl-D-alanine dipeptidase